MSEPGASDPMASEVRGVLVVHKPKGPTSHDVVARLRRIAATRRVGHCGTLDPMAEGVLVCCIGRATRIVPWLTGLKKDYTGEMTLGAVSNTYDALGRVEPMADPGGIDAKDLAEAFRRFTGFIEQQAPAYSAVKVRGRKLYEYARKGEEVPRKVRTVWVERLELLRHTPPRALFAARVGSGTYIRSLAHDIGQALGCGAYLSALCRTAVGSFAIEDAADLDALEENPEALGAALLPERQALGHLPHLVLSPRAEGALRNGRPFAIDEVLECPGAQPVGCPTLALSNRGEAIAIVQADDAQAPYRPLRVLVSG